MDDIGQYQTNDKTQKRSNDAEFEDFVLEKSIFSNVFGKDIRRVYLYKKAVRLAKALALIAPAFPHSSALRGRIDAMGLSLMDAAILPPPLAKETLSRELLALASVLALARAGGLLSPMNADIIAKEVHFLLAEVASYEEPRLFLEEAPTLAGLLKQSVKTPAKSSRPAPPEPPKISKGHIRDIPKTSERKDSILSIMREKGTVYIKDLSTTIRGVSEKTIQRELQKLVADGVVSRSGERRWTAYKLAESQLTSP